MLVKGDPGPILNGNLAKWLLKLGRGWLIISHVKYGCIYLSMSLSQLNHASKKDSWCIMTYVLSSYIRSNMILKWMVTYFYYLLWFRRFAECDYPTPAMDHWKHQALFEPPCLPLFSTTSEQMNEEDVTYVSFIIFGNASIGNVLDKFSRTLREWYLSLFPILKCS